MSEKQNWIECREMSRRDFRMSGGCFWRNVRNSPGGHIRIPNGTPFRVRRFGPQSREYVRGSCRDNRWCLDGKGTFLSANLAVKEARPDVKATNAFEYVELRVGNQWMLADDVRQVRTISLPRDPVEDIAFAKAKELIRKKSKSQKLNLSREEIDAKAEEALDTNESLWEYARLMAEPLDLSFA